MAKFTKKKDKIVLSLTYEDVWRAWCEKRSYFKTPVQVASEKGLAVLKLEKVAAIETKPTEIGIEIIYFLTIDALFQ